MPTPYQSKRPATQDRFEFLGSYHAAARSAVRAAKSAGELKAVTASALRDLDQRIAEGVIRLRTSIACCPGCCYCCYLKVDVTPSEAFLLADHVRKNFAEDEINAVLAMADENRRRIFPMSLNQHLAANLPCPFLRVRECSVYPVRPARCRMFHAQTVRTCQASFEQPEKLDIPDSQVRQLCTVLELAHFALDQAYELEGYDTRSYDLNAAVLEALRDPRCERRWRNKKRAFARTALAKDHVEDETGGQ